MSESGDYDAGPWKGYDFASAKVAYKAHAGRSYADASVAGKTMTDCVPEKITTNSESPLIICCDVTGSMGEWPATIFSKLPYLDLEGKEYLGKSMEVCFAAVGDAFSDKYPLQVREFAGGTDMEKSLKELIIEGGGGGSRQESYDLAALYMLKNCECPKAIRKPILIFIGDEGFYNFVDKDKGCAWGRCTLEDKISLQDLFKELNEKFSVYAVLKPYSVTSKNEKMDGPNKAIYEEWVALLGEERVAVLPEASRVVDVIFGLLASDTGRISYFTKELKDRQEDDKVSVVLKSLHTIHTPKSLRDSKSMKKLAAPSVTRRKKGDDSKPKSSKSLL